MTITIYKIDGRIAIIEMENGKFQNIITSLLPKGVKEGDVIDVDKGIIIKRVEAAQSSSCT